MIQRFFNSASGPIDAAVAAKNTAQAAALSLQQNQSREGDRKNDKRNLYRYEQDNLLKKMFPNLQKAYPSIIR